MANGLFGGGSGTVLDPYIIEDIKDLLKMSEGLSLFYKLAGDIDLSILPDILSEDLEEGEELENYKGWEPIGRHYRDLENLSLGTDNNIRFSGCLDGDGFSIKNLFIDRESADRQGLFGYLNHATIKNLKIVDANVTGRDNIGCLVGYMENNSVIENCEIVNSTTNGRSYVGGLIGNSHSSDTSKIRSIDAIVNNTGSYSGGILGNIITGGVHEDIFIKNCTINYNSSYCGGLTSYASSSTFRNIVCVNVDIYGNSSYVAGLIGYPTSCNIRNIKVTGTVRGSSYTSGVVGYIVSTPFINVVSTVKSEVTSTSYSGGVSGRVSSSTHTRVIWNEDTAGDYLGSSNGTRSNTNEMTTFPRYEGFETEELLDETKIWNFKFGHYPRLYLEDDFEEDGLQHEIALGEGTASNPYIVTNPRELDLMRNDLRAHYRLGNSIDLDVAPYNQDEYRQPIGTNRLIFTGSFDGNGYSINNLKINTRTAYEGLFGYVRNSEIKDLTIKDAKIKGTGYIGALAGQANNCFLRNIFVDNCEMDATSDHSGIVVGMVSNSCDLETIRSKGVIRSTSSYVGAFGSFLNSNIKESLFDNNVLGISYVGVFSGRTTGCNIINCKASGSASGTSSYISGFSAELTSTSISNVFSTARVVGSSRGGLTTYTAGGITSSNCYWDVESSTINTSSFGIGMQTVDMKAPAYYVDWDREERVDTSKVWQFKMGEYPRLWFEEEFSLDDSQFFGGSGTVNDPYLISTRRQFDLIKGDLSAHYKLVQDIDLSDTDDGSQGWSGIGLSHVRFTGSLDGGGKSIKNLTIVNPTKDYNGLFGYTKDAKIRHLFLNNIKIVGRNYIGGVTGSSENTEFESISVSGKITGTSYLGGLVGQGTLKANATHSSCEVSGSTFLGCLVGDSSAGSEIVNSYTNGIINGTSSHRGGLIGYNRSIVRNCYSTSFVGPGSGGLIGGCIGTVSDSYWDNELCGTTISAKGFPLTSLELKSFYSIKDWANERIRGISVWKTRYKEYPRLWFETDFVGIDRVYFAGGDGSITDPYLIEDVHDLDYMRNDLEAHYKIVKDIDINDGEYINDSNWTPVGTNSLKFRGTLDGNNKTISSLVINRPDNDRQGLFGEAEGATLKNLNIENANIDARDYVGILVGKEEQSTIELCHVIGSINARSYIGTLIGESLRSTIRNCSSRSLELNGLIKSGSYVGGLIGSAHSDIDCCYSRCKVRGVSFIGGVLGQLQGPNGSLKNSYSIGDVWSSSSYIGGVVGYNYASISNIFANNSVGNGSGAIGGVSGSTQVEVVWNRETSNLTSSSGGGTLVNSEEIRTYTPFRGWKERTDNEGNKVWKFKYKELPRLWFEEDFEEDGKTFFIGGDGTSSNPYLVQSAEDLDYIRNDLFAHYKLTRDIDLNVIPFNEGNGWRPLGYTNLFFRGLIDGDGYSVRNLLIRNETNDYSGLFSRLVNAEVKNLNINRTSLTARNYVGNLAGYAINSKIDSVNVTESVIQAFDDVGGLIGRIDTDTSITNSRHSGSTSGRTHVGGITGYSVTRSRIWSSSSSGRIRHTGSYGGGIAGYNLTGSIVKSCYSNAIINTFNTYSGGLVGYNTGIIESSLSTGEIRNPNNFSHTGGFVGNSSTVINGCFWDIETSRTTVSHRGEGKTTQELQEAKLYYDADWKDDRLSNGIPVWFIGDGKYPTLWMDGYEKILIRNGSRVFTIDDTGEKIEVTSRISNIDRITREEFLELGMNYIEELDLFKDNHKLEFDLVSSSGTNNIFKKEINLSDFEREALRIEVI